MIKTFPKTRVCVIDCYPCFEQGLQTAWLFANKNNIHLNTSDGKKLILRFCLKAIENQYKSVDSPFPKVFCLSEKAITQKIQTFIDKHFDKMMEHLPFPYCGKYDLNSPDLETAAEQSLKLQKSQQKYQTFIKKSNFRDIN
jgi:hypothetical protein